MRTPVLQLRDLSYAYGERQVLRQLNLTIGRGELVALLGPNGSGKSTLFQLLSTLRPAKAGAIDFFGQDPAQGTAGIRARLGVLFQQPALDRKLRVRENLWCAGKMYGLGGRELGGRIEQRSKQLGLSDRLEDVVETLSGGWQRRVEIAKSLLPEPEFLLLDEPSTGLDVSARQACGEIYRELARAGTTVFLTTHLLEEAEMADRVLLLHEGKFVADGAPQELCSSLGAQLLRLRSREARSIWEELGSEEKAVATLTGDELRFRTENPVALLPSLQSRFGRRVEAWQIQRPSLADVFFHHAGMSLSEAEEVIHQS
jgi:ABC-2 type transport system ATP-binding protein